MSKSKAKKSKGVPAQPQTIPAPELELRQEAAPVISESLEEKPRLYFCIAAYNAEATLEQCIRSVRPYADEIIVVEGRFRNREGPLHSTDLTLAIADRYACRVIDGRGLPQNEQRDLYLVGKPGDFYFVIDSDEVLEGEFDRDSVLGGPYDVYGVWIKKPEGGEWVTLRLYRHVADQGHRPHHNPGQLLIDGYGKLMDATHDNYVFATKWWLRHL